LQRGDVLASDTPHEVEHCLEVQLPFLQCVLRDFALLPLVIGSTSAEHVAAVLRDVWGGSETLVLASSDLSHYLSYDSAKEVDAVTASAIVSRHADISHHQACGASGINGLLVVAQQLGLDVTEIARLNSGDTSGDVRRVVGYGAFAIHESRQRTTQ
jgi:AmmeMemoRadiSam system protein B